MDSTPPNHQHRSELRARTKSASRLAQTEEVPHLSLGLIESSPKRTLLSPSVPSLKSPSSLPLKELLLLSPSPLRRSKTRLADRLDMAEEPAEQVGVRRRCKTRTSQLGLLGCASPRNARRSRRRSEIEVREEKDLPLAEEFGKPRKRRHSTRSKKEKLSLVPSVPSSSLSPKIDEDCQGSLDRIGCLISDLVMWRDVAKSSLWFGFGSLFFFSSCFAQGFSFSIFSAISKLGFLFLGLSFFSNSIRQRDNNEGNKESLLKEDDILRFARMILPFTNLAISKTRDVFSGEPSMTLKVAPLLLLGAEYGHLFTLWRLSAIGFFMAFMVPKMYSSYSIQISQKVEYLIWRVLETWGTCSHKKMVAISAITAFWNLSSLKTRIFTAFICLVLVRYCRQHIVEDLEEREVEGEREGEGNQEQEQEQEQGALILADVVCQQ
ncbi:reticulon-like protein B17 [Humulus lupulus]|uniref:reticulon-like protein B17 n=1 Tax=Humulus lupulus TaxID=3486 RepID=UPI002B40B744|nr:reticulon-like protein B17 [Humulus lupulus]